MMRIGNRFLRQIIYFLVPFLLNLVLGKDCLECYQCSDTKDPVPVCDDIYWHALTDQKKENLIIGCQPKVSDFCVKVEQNITGTRITERGCIPNRDSQGNELKEGCIEYELNGAKNKICFCGTSLCNSGSVNDYRFISIIFIILILFTKV